MKKYLWMAALASVALAGCVSEEVAEIAQVSQKKKLSFGAPVMYQQSRSYDGEIVDNKYPENELFRVFAVETNGNFVGWTATNVVKRTDGTDFFPADGVIVQKGTDDYWYITGNTTYYWPDETDHKLTFAAYSPSRAADDGKISYGASGLTITDFKVNEDVSKQYDLMYSTRTVDATASPVNINFHHALSSIRFKFVKPEEGSAYDIMITKLSISGGVLDIGTFKQDIAENSQSSSGTPVWTEQKHVMDETDPSKEINIEYVLFSGEWSVPAKTGSEITASNYYSFLPIPQAVTKDMVVNIEYKTKQTATDEYGEVIKKSISFHDFKFTDSNGALTYTPEWKRNTRYYYHVHFGALKEIFFKPVMSDWVDETEAGTYDMGATVTSGNS